MTSTTPTSIPGAPPSWPHCGHGAAPPDLVGCRGTLVGNHTFCLAHLNDTDRTAYLATLSPGSGIDHRGTTFTPELLRELLGALNDPATTQPRIGVAQFREAAFELYARFNGATFEGAATFDEATFEGTAEFRKTTFKNIARFERATFEDAAIFDEATFEGTAEFRKTTFKNIARFGGATFEDAATFYEATFEGNTSFWKAKFGFRTEFHLATFNGNADFTDATFNGSSGFIMAEFRGIAWFEAAKFNSGAEFQRAIFDGDVEFKGATFNKSLHLSHTRFQKAQHLGPLSCAETASLDAATFDLPVTLKIAAAQVSCVRTQWASTATLHLRHAKINLSDAVFEYPVSITARRTPFSIPGSPTLLTEGILSDLDFKVSLVSLDGVDAAHLVLNDISLSECRFAGVVHLDQLKVDGRCTFAKNPKRWSLRFPWKQSLRNTLIEEHHWRVRTARRPARAVALGWADPTSSQDTGVPPATVAALYRQLRKSLEDGKNEPDAADFYYGECEMRRHDTTRPPGERMLLRFYWALSGYGLRAKRALAWLGVSMTVTVAMMMLWGLPVDDPKPATTGRQVAVGQDISLVTDTPKPVNPTGALVDRISTDRFEKGLRTVINSVIFRSSGQNLTTAGIYFEMFSRLTEPVLLGLAVLAIRNRVKR
ncbi:pentapeptide repeat-containing protein [Streptomyces sp. NPDC094049]|uniref:pentapeptide repeat-containing protein n=1 Tax=Streptomyces sp. NPDC094049 TaxID=3154987 RepID=UPI0033247D3B